jgi:hypothetical protein
LELLQISYSFSSEVSSFVARRYSSFTLLGLISAIPTAIAHELNKNIVPKLLGAFLTAAVFGCKYRLVVGFLSANPTVTGFRLLAVRISLVPDPGGVAEEILSLLRHFTRLNSLLFYSIPID